LTSQTKKARLSFMSRNSSWVLGVVLLGSGIAHAQGSPDAVPTQIGIFNITVVGIDAALQQTMIDALATEVASLEGVQVVSLSELEAMLGAESLKDQMGCDDVSCLTEIGTAAGVEKIIAGSVSRVDETHVVSLQLVNVRDASVENRVTLSWKGTAGEIADVLGAAGEILVVSRESLELASISIEGIPTSAAIAVDGKTLGTGPQVISGIAVGVHTVTITDGDYEAYSAHIVTRRGQTRPIMASLTPVSVPVYTKWWFWAAGAAVLGGAAVLLLSTNDDSGGGSTTGTITISGPTPGGS
jgi:hypothetical protein